MTAAARAGACDSCLRRSRLVADMAPRIAGMLGRGRAHVPGLLALPDHELIEATGGGRRELARARLARFDARAERRSLAEAGVAAVCRHSAGYPSGLLELADPPAALFVVGRQAALAELGERPAVAIVGTRRPSPYGAEVARALGRGLGAAGVTVVSGLALGIDATAHRGCLDAGGTPLAVLACGPERAYPRRHDRLHRAVAAAGAVVSELPPGTPIQRWSFPARNRIMAGLARLTVVVEAAEPSGSLITAEFARDLGRSVAAVPGRITATTARGTNGLLRDGAVPVTGTEDVLDELFGVGIRPVPPPPAGPAGPLAPALRAVLRAVEDGSGVDEIACRTGSSAAAVRAALGRLEADGLVVRGSLGGWERAAV
jgi:DNA processing protein